MELFEAVKEAVSARTAAEFYGIDVKSNEMARCIFHNDRNPSMKLDRRYHCFACQADGDVINLVAAIFGIGNKEAAEKIAADFGISYGSMRSLSDILADCRIAFSQMTESEKAAAAESLVGKNAMSGFLALMNAAPEDIEKLETAISTCSDEIDGYSGTAEKMAAVMQDNLNGQLTILKSQLEELAISFGDMLMPMIRKAVTSVQGFVDKLNGMSEGQRNAILKEVFYGPRTHF